MRLSAAAAAEAQDICACSTRLKGDSAAAAALIRSR